MGDTLRKMTRRQADIVFYENKAHAPPLVIG